MRNKKTSGEIERSCGKITLKGQLMTNARQRRETKRSLGNGLASRYVSSVGSVASSQRTGVADLQLGMILTFIAGAINAGGFLAVGQYTSHMSGIFSSMADHLALGALDLVLVGFAALAPFVIGAGCSAILINWGRRRGLDSQYALPLLLEAALLLAFGLYGSHSPSSRLFTPAVIAWLCFIMGLQNATVTKISGARMRTTHVTGIITDIGIELGKLCYWNRDASIPRVDADSAKLKLLLLLLTSFFVGGIAGAVGFKWGGALFALPLALTLFSLAVSSIARDVSKHRSEPPSLSP
ncbi:YoaK family protein [Microvirga puerhi]|uniref:YoaK family protein n=1 Tax=Microvirga puerhi TaxID=2876078 RepID=UPI003F6F3317